MTAVQQLHPLEVRTLPGRVLVGRRNPYTAYLNGGRDQLTGLGFEEFDGPRLDGPAA